MARRLLGRCARPLLAVVAVASVAAVVWSCADVIGLGDIQEVACIADACVPDGGGVEHGSSGHGASSAAARHTSRSTGSPPHDAGRGGVRDATLDSPRETRRDGAIDARGPDDAARDSKPHPPPDAPADSKRRPRDAAGDGVADGAREEAGSGTGSRSSTSRRSSTSVEASTGSERSSTSGSVESSNSAAASSSASLSESSTVGPESSSATVASSSSEGCTDERCAAANPSTPVCDANTGTCVVCLPPDTGCPDGTECIVNVGTGTYECAQGCVGTGPSNCPLSDAGAQLQCCNGGCSDVTSDPNNCGGCGQACPTTNATATCVASSCSVTCVSPEFTNCAGTIDTEGCPVDLYNDTSNCTACNNVCPTLNATATCSPGGCQVTCASPEYANCEGTIDTVGCPTDVDTDPANCGGCNAGCPGAAENASSTCSGGACQVSCLTPEFANCNGTIQTAGCPVDLYNDVDNCTACGTVCSTTNATASCSAMGCDVTCVSPEYTNCDGTLAANGCNVDLYNDTCNCGSCDTAATCGDGCVECYEGNAYSICSQDPVPGPHPHRGAPWSRLYDMVKGSVTGE